MTRASAFLCFEKAGEHVHMSIT